MDTFRNSYWPATYVADRDGRIRYRHVRKGGYRKTGNVLRTLMGVDPASPRAAAPAGGDGPARCRRTEPAR